ncbi:hypothetical protein VB796_20695 [Arcicella sp. LKC2W]|nr:hypothetical protein [Arcicella sp. LKC2W]MEA5461497.1 hypothetical protein [Arcicella sp. LKC2W]
MKFHQMLQLMAEIRSIIEMERPLGLFIILGSPSPTLIKKYG